MTKRVLLSILTILVVICLCLSLVAIPGVILVASRGLPGIGNPTATPLPLITPFPTDPSSGSLPEIISRQMDQIQVQVIQIRGLAQLKALKRDMLTPDQLRKRVTDEFFKDYTPDKANQDARLMSALGLLAPGFDLHQLYLDLYSEQIAGYYDSETKEMFVIQGGSFGGPERMTYAHEFTHALQDQHYDLREGLKIKDDYCQTHSEYCAGVQALIEGDATLSEQDWLSTYATAEDRQQIQAFYSTYRSPVYDSAPAFMKDDFLFPYRQGLEFVQSLFDQGGWPAIDAAFTNPPVSTEQILHSELYPQDRPMEVTLPDLAGALGAGWKELERNTLGEWYTYLVLSRGRDSKFQISTSQASKAAAGWGGDTYAVLSGPEQGMALIERWKWDTAGDAEEFWQALQDYGSKRWGDPTARTQNRLGWQGTADGVVALVQRAQETLWVITPDAGTMQKVLATLPDFQEQ